MNGMLSAPSAGPGRSYELLTSRPLRLVDHDRAAGDRLWIRGVNVARAPELVVEDHSIRVVVVRDPDPELIRSDRAHQVTVVCGEREVVAARAVHGPRALVLGLEAGDDEPLVDRCVEVEVADLEVELGLAGRNCRVLLVLRVEAEVRATGKRGVRPVRAVGDIQPAAAGDVAAVRVVDDDPD